MAGLPGPMPSPKMAAAERKGDLTREIRLLTSAATGVETLQLTARSSSAPEEGPPHDQEHGQHEGERIFPDVSNKTRGVDVLLIGDGFDHEVRSVADVGVRAEKDRTGADRQDEFAEGGVSEEKTNPDL